ncbi:MAG: CapA family protein [Candidatus Thermoplasmatota archaeon]|nr:CapA family protein [Candidatus Thermoplasmatota archaeon]
MAVSVLLFSSISVEAEDSREIKLVFMGDVVFDGEIGERIETYGTEYPFEKMMPCINDADLTFANLETPVSDRGQEEVGKYCTFRSDPETIGCLEDAGIDAVSLANNHCLDYSYDALNDTMECLDDAGIGHAGIWYDDPIENATLQRPVVLEAGGITFGFLAYTENVRDHWMATSELPGPMPLDRGLMERDIDHARDLVDVLIVSIHWRKWPQYTEAPEESDIELCHDVIDWGANMIMGHGPHTVHEVEGYNDGLIFYSLGNAAIDTADESSDHSYIAKVSVDGEGSISSLELIPTYKETHRYVPMGTPMGRDASMGFNISYEQVWDMYDKDIYDALDGEGGLEVMLLLRDSPWYFKGFLLVSAIIIVSGTSYIVHMLIRRRKDRGIS